MVQSEVKVVPQRYAVAVDGSQASDLAFQVAMDGLYRDNVDTLNVLTITNSKKTDIPFNFRPEYIEEKYKSRMYDMISHKKGDFYMRETDHLENKTVKEEIYDLANAIESTILVVGNHGRKGPRE